MFGSDVCQFRVPPNWWLSFWLPLRPTFTKVPLRLKKTAQTPEFSEFSEFSSPGLQPAPPSSPAWQNVEEPPGPPPGPRLEPPVLTERAREGDLGPSPAPFWAHESVFWGSVPRTWGQAQKRQPARLLRCGSGIITCSHKWVESQKRRCSLCNGHDFHLDHLVHTLGI